MNGLRYIRTRCNLSLNELASFLGISRQALSAWENGRKEIPDHRLEQLEEFLGVDKKYFGEISEEDKIYLMSKAMFQCDQDGKEYYLYRPQHELKDNDDVSMYFWTEREISLSDEYAMALKKMQEVLDKIEDIIIWTTETDILQSKIMCIQRGCKVYGIINQMMDEMRRQERYLKIPFFYELMNVWQAMLMAYGLMSEDDVKTLNSEGAHVAEDKEWILALGEQIKNHWKKEELHHRAHHEKIMKEHRASKGNPSKYANMTAKEKIADAEESVRREIEKVIETTGKTIIIG